MEYTPMLPSVDAERINRYTKLDSSKPNAEYDQYIRDYFFLSDGTNRLKPQHAKEVWLKNHEPKTLEYLLNRYKDSECLRETFNRIYFGVEIRPVCKCCGGPVSYWGRKGSRMFSETCCNGKCYTRLRDERMLVKYGTTNFGGTEESLKKIAETKMRKYGDPWYSNREKGMATYSEKYKPGSEARLEVTRKSKKTCLERYGDENYRNTEKNKKTCLDRYGVDNYRKTGECVRKIFETRKKNGTVTTSKIEEKCYVWLIEEYGRDNVIRQYSDIRYKNPENGHLYRCDFYVRSIDTFIEIQGYWSHGPHPYNSQSDEDSKLAEEWKIKGEKNHNYIRAINSWTCIDVTKRRVAEDSGIKLVEIFNRSIEKDELIEKINELQK